MKITVQDHFHFHFKDLYHFLFNFIFTYIIFIVYKVTVILVNQDHYLRLCLVLVKYFPENIYFPKMLFSEKENIFKYLVAFQKIFWKIFSSVWLYS